MDQGVAAVVVGVITAIGGILAALVQVARRENHKDHAAVGVALIRLRQAVERTANSIERVDLKIDRHLLDHEKETESGLTQRD